MIEVIGYNEFGKALEKLGIEAHRTLDPIGHQGVDVSVWEMSRKSFKALSDAVTTEEWWEEQNAGWYHAVGTNLGEVNKRFRVNGHYLEAWDNEDEHDPDRVRHGNTPFRSISEYLDNCVGATTQRNVVSCYYDLARQNGMKISELLRKYGP